jgi:hypothetical protein
MSFEDVKRTVALNIPPPKRNSLSLAASEMPTMALLGIWPNICGEHICAHQASQEFGKYPVNGRHLMYLRSRVDVASGRPAAAICGNVVLHRQRHAGGKEEEAECVATNSGQLLLVSNFRMLMTCILTLDYT